MCSDTNDIDRFRLWLGGSEIRRKVINLLRPLVVRGLHADQLNIEWFTDNFSSSFVSDIPSINSSMDHAKALSSALSSAGSECAIIVNLDDALDGDDTGWTFEVVTLGASSLHEVLNAYDVPILVLSSNDFNAVVLFHPWEEYTIAAGSLEFLLQFTDGRVMESALAFELLHRQLWVYGKGTAAGYRRPMVAALNDWLISEDWTTRLGRSGQP